MRANERADERMAQYSTHLILNHPIHLEVVLVGDGQVGRHFDAVVVQIGL